MTAADPGDIKRGDVIRIHGLQGGPVDVPVAEVVDGEDGSVTIVPRRTLTLTDFLLARIAEDEEKWTPFAGYIQPWTVRLDFADSAAEVTIDPARVLAECEAKRATLREHAIGPTGDCGVCSYWSEYPCPTVRFVAAVYSDHPDFREEWRP